MTVAVTGVRQNVSSEGGETIARWIRADPVHAAETIFGVKLWRAQRRILRALFSHRRVTVKTCHKAGKSFVASLAVLLWAFAYPRASKTTTTAPGQQQVYGILWSTIRALWERAAERGIVLGNKPSKGKWEIAPDWYAQGFKPSDYREDMFQGFNSRHSLVIADEASGISKNILDGARGITSNDGSTLLLIGNAINPASEFARSFTLSGYEKITISAYDTPNFTSLGISREDLEGGRVDVTKLPRMPHTHLIGPAYAVEALENGGPAKSNMTYQSRVLADFPTHSDDTLIPYDWIRAAQDRWGEVHPVPSALSLIAYDVAHSPTGDESVIGHRFGHRYRLITAGRGWHTQQGAAKARDAVISCGASAMRMDHLGAGVGVYDALQGMMQDGSLPCEVTGFPAGSPDVLDPERFVNLRAEAWWSLRTRLDPEGGFDDLPIEIEPDPRLEAQVAAIRWSQRLKDGKILIESKDSMKGRGLSSPDRGDALMMAFAPMKQKEEFFDDFV